MVASTLSSGLPVCAAVCAFAVVAMEVISVYEMTVATVNDAPLVITVSRVVPADTGCGGGGVGGLDGGGGGEGDGGGGDGDSGGEGEGGGGEGGGGEGGEPEPEPDSLRKRPYTVSASPTTSSVDQASFDAVAAPQRAPIRRNDLRMAGARGGNVSSSSARFGS